MPAETFGIHSTRHAFDPAPPEIKAGPRLLPALPTVPQPAKFVRRRGSLAQGQALETLGHAVEYLIDSGLFAGDERSRKDDTEAVQILMRLSRAVFLECPEVQPLRRRLGGWLVRKSAPLRAAAPLKRDRTDRLKPDSWHCDCC